MTSPTHYSELVLKHAPEHLPRAGEVQQFASDTADVELFSSQLRCWRNLQMAAIAAADISRQLPLKNVIEGGHKKLLNWQLERRLIFTCNNWLSALENV